jgi:hypothetical protein
MAEGRAELEWDLSNNVMASVINASKMISATIIGANGGKPKPYTAVDFTTINPYRR